MKLLLLCAAFLALVSIVFCRGLPSEEEDRPGLGGSVRRYLKCDSGSCSRAEHGRGGGFVQ